MKFDKNVWRTLALISQLGISIIVPILLCTLGGAWLEKKFSLPFTLPLMILGILAGVRNAYYLLKEANKDEEK